MSSQQRRPRNLLAALVGAVVGASIVSWIANPVGSWYADTFFPNGDLGDIASVVVVAILGTVFGTAAGCWLALRLRRADMALPTALLAGTLSPLAVLVVAIFFPADLRTELDQIDPRFGFGSLGLGAAIAAVGVRLFVTSRGSRERERTWNTP